MYVQSIARAHAAARVTTDALRKTICQGHALDLVLISGVLLSAHVFELHEGGSEMASDYVDNFLESMELDKVDLTEHDFYSGHIEAITSIRNRVLFDYYAFGKDYFIDNPMHADVYRGLTTSLQCIERLAKLA